MINVIIIEDEAPARRKLRRYLGELDDRVAILAECETITDALAYLRQNNKVHLILSDISLRDGNAFAIYEQITDLPPIIFTTAYDEYLMNAFETNGIGYLLKPYTLNQFRNAWEKFMRLRDSSADHSSVLTKLSDLFEEITKPLYKKRFAFHSGTKTLFLETSTIAYFVAEDSVVFAVGAEQQRHLLAQSTLREVSKLLDPAMFFKINRGEMVNINFVERLERYNKNSIAIKLKGFSGFLVTSQSKTAAFREWVER